MHCTYQRHILKFNYSLSRKCEGKTVQIVLLLLELLSCFEITWSKNQISPGYSAKANMLCAIQHQLVHQPVFLTTTSYFKSFG